MAALNPFSIRFIPNLPNICDIPSFWREAIDPVPQTNSPDGILRYSNRQNG